MSISRQEIAARVNVSPRAVSYALNGQPGVSPEVRERILQIAQEMGYRRNAAAKSTRAGRFDMATLLFSTAGHRSTIFPGLVSGTHDALADRGMQLTIARVDDAKLTSERFVPQALREWSSDGLLIYYTHDIPPALIELLGRYRIPSIWMNSQQASDCVYFDDQAAGRELTEHLLGLGHRRIAFVHYSGDIERHYSVAGRAAGYEQAMREAGLAPRRIERTFRPSTKDGPGDSTVELSQDWLQQPDRPTAIVTYGSKEANAAMHAGALLGLRVPQDLSVVTFSDRIGDDSGIPLTRMWTSHATMARAAVPMLLQKIEQPARPLEARAIPLSFWQGVSCQALKS